MTDGKPHLLFIAEPKQRLIDMLSEHFQVDVMPTVFGPERDRLIEEHAPLARALISISFLQPSREQVRMMTSLEHLAYLGSGYQSMDLEAYREMGVTGSFVPAANSDAVAEYAIALTLAAMRRMIEADKFVRDGRWGPEFGPPMNPELFGRAVGIVGLGQAGMRIARIAEAMGTRVAYHKPTPNPDVLYTYYPSLVELAVAVDVLIVACPGGPATHLMVNAEVLAALGPEGYLVNIARGSVVENGALVDALRAGRIAGAGLDVIDGEPKLPEGLVALDNVVLSPHRAGVTHDAVRTQWEKGLANLLAHFEGRPVPTPIPELEP